MVGIALVIIAGFILVYNLDKSAKKQKSRRTRKSPTQRQFKNDIPGKNWIFKRNLEEAAVPEIVKKFRIANSGKSFTDIVKMLHVALEQEKNEIQSALMFMQISEPLLELMDLKYLERDEIEGLLWYYFEVLLNNYSSAGAMVN